MYHSVCISKEKMEPCTRILEKAWKHMTEVPIVWKHLPNYWRIPKMIGFNYAMELKDKEKGAPYIVATGKIPGSPPLYRTWGATLYKRAGKMEKGAEALEDMLAIETLNSQLNSVDEGATRDQIRWRLAAYYQKLYGEHGAARLQLLEEKIQKWVGGWREKYPYLPFLFFMINQSQENDPT